ncbi:universal stress protein [Acidovorax sp. MR-S7]|uniref:universal stress protein n=1 Tax=Acidovorax sp. MR-S7 TaxID=1268622 RepID=UPI00037A0EF4|nr:universal stress protein [Acidovorax sp. MR-S7]GAD24388.1 universal stress protein UspA and related nucleotide-binding proteins [Acidovorax sp. MR-S7]
MNPDIRTILYASDLGEGCEAALAYAIGLADRLGARLQVLTVISDERERSLVDIDSHVPQQALDQYHDRRAVRTLAHIEAQVAGFYDARGGAAPRQPVTELIVHEGDDVPQAILDAADRGGADLVLMASRGKGVLAGLLFGSATQEVLRRTRKPLLLVPVGE